MKKPRHSRGTHYFMVALKAFEMNGRQSRDVRMGYPCSNCVDAEYKCQRPVTNPVITTELLRGPEGEEIIQPWECPIP
jgi:hypothetical protein